MGVKKKVLWRRMPPKDLRDSSIDPLQTGVHRGYVFARQEDFSLLTGQIAQDMNGFPNIDITGYRLDELVVSSLSRFICGEGAQVFG